ncbi:ketopantoate reductase family protein [Sneathia sanguinegens]|uniref:2-dehydropantoate 2-reductase n=1 Tax=Sneathia sanguinegens TaxID=40543 RepID=A0ABT7HJZ4_9FUSO|nr:2-dehydropantoate 2-reductase [Sneathia sanguinegens]MDK9580464.1 2-dehydropantoate 2-reductase [Sneathia sanguinegens]
MKILIAGIGAMGGSFAHKLSNKHEIVAIDTWQENVKKINENGLTVVDLGEKIINKNIKAYMLEEYKEKADLIIIFVKSMLLETMLEKLKPNIGDNTKVLCMLNGLGHIQTLKKYIKAENIVIGISLITASLKSAGSIALTSYAYNEISGLNEKGRENAKMVAKLITDCGLPTNFVNDVKEAIWEKACVNGVFNSLSTILDLRLGEFRDLPRLEHILKEIIEEFHKIALFEGVDFDKNKAFEKVYRCTQKGYQGEFHYPSMHQDLRQHGRKTEIDFLNGYISEKGKEYGEKTPYCDLITFEIKALERKLIK